MDYGNTEEMSLSSLAPLHEGFLVFPSQMQHCTFSAQPSSVSREVSEGEVVLWYHSTAHVVCCKPAAALYNRISLSYHINRRGLARM